MSEKQAEDEDLLLLESNYRKSQKMKDPEHLSHDVEHVDKEKLRDEFLTKSKKMKEIIATGIMSIARIAH